MPRTFFLSFVLLMGLVALLFHIKYQVLFLEGTYQKKLKIHQEIQDHVHVLQAEWTYLNAPQRLHQLAKKYLTLVPLSPAQILSFETLKKKETLIRQPSVRKPYRQELDHFLLSPDHKQRVG